MDRLWAMQVFVRVVDCGSFSRAAESLDLANATVTSSLRNLEKHLGVTLIQRNTRFLRLTDEGTAYYERCVELLRGIDQAELEVKGQSGKVGGILRIESPVTFGRTLLCPMMSAFTARHPGLSVAMTLTDHPQNLIAQGIDVSIRIDHVSDSDLVARAIYQSRYVVCGSPALAGTVSPLQTPRDLPAQQCLGLLMPGTYTAATWRFASGEDHYHLRPEGQINYNSSDALAQAALDGKGFIYVLDVFVNKLIASGQLVELFGEWSTASRTFYAVTAKGRFVAPKARAFIDYLLESLDMQRRPSPNSLVAVQAPRAQSTAAQTNPKSR